MDQAVGHLHIIYSEVFSYGSVVILYLEHHEDQYDDHEKCDPCAAGELHYDDNDKSNGSYHCTKAIDGCLDMPLGAFVFDPVDDHSQLTQQE